MTKRTSDDLDHIPADKLLVRGEILWGQPQPTRLITPKQWRRVFGPAAGAALAREIRPGRRAIMATAATRAISRELIGAGLRAIMHDWDAKPPRPAYHGHIFNHARTHCERCGIRRELIEDGVAGDCPK